MATRIRIENSLILYFPTQDNGLFEGMETLQSNNNIMNLSLLGDGDKMQPRDEEQDYDEEDDDDDEVREAKS